MTKKVENQLVKNIREFIEKGDSMEVNRHYCYYRAYIAREWLSHDVNLYEDLYFEYSRYFLKEYEETGKNKCFW